eukprot:6527722-Alexandrium_andersonii.AAC.1
MGGVVSADASPADEARARASAGSAVICTTRGKVLSNHLASVETREGLLSFVPGAHQTPPQRPRLGCHHHE